MSPSLEKFASARAPHEIKFLVSPETAEKIRAWAAQSMQHDPHSAPALNNAYLVESIYFDTPNFDVFHKNGSYARGKYRIRKYLPAGIVFLERKLKAKGVVRKRRTSISPSEMDHLRKDLNKAWPGFWYHRRVALRQLEPVCAISYLRYPFLAGKSPEPMRLTIDQKLCATRVDGCRFPENNGHAEFLKEHAILEMKYLGDTPTLFKSLIDQFGLSAEPVSKYRLAVPILGLATKKQANPSSLETPLVLS